MASVAAGTDKEAFECYPTTRDRVPRAHTPHGHQSPQAGNAALDRHQHMEFLQIVPP